MNWLDLILGFDKFNLMMLTVLLCIEINITYISLTNVILKT